MGAVGPGARNVFFTEQGADPIIALDDFLTSAEVANLIARAEAQEWHPALINLGDGVEELDVEERRHTRTYVDDPEFAASVSARLKRLVRSAAHDFVNPRFRVLKYVPGDYFRPHYDGEQEHLGGRSTHTLLIYLNDLPDTGATHFTETDIRIFPKRGRAVLFKQEDHEHEGESPMHGVKLVMRTDLMVRNGVGEEMD